MKALGAIFLVALIQAEAWGAELNRVIINGESLIGLRLLAQQASTSGTDRATVSCVSIQERCYRRANEFPIIHLRATGKWSEGSLENSILRSLDANNMAAIQEYADFTIKNLGLEQSSERRFVVEVQFRYGTEVQTNYVFGEIKSGSSRSPVINVTSYADINDGQETARIRFKTLGNILNSGRDFQSAVAQVRLEDHRRGQAVGAAVEAWMIAVGSSLGEGTAPKPIAAAMGFPY